MSIRHLSDAENGRWQYRTGDKSELAHGFGICINSYDELPLMWST